MERSTVNVLVIAVEKMAMEPVFKVLSSSIVISLSLWITALSHRERYWHWREVQWHRGEFQHWGERRHRGDYNEEPNTKENKSEETIYIECENYLKKCGYPAGASKLEIVDGILHYKGKHGLRQVVTGAKTIQKILEACRGDWVGRCHFGQDKMPTKVTVRSTGKESFRMLIHGYIST